MPIELNRVIQSNTLSPSSSTSDVTANTATGKKKIARSGSLRNYVLPVVLPCPCAPFADGSPSADAHIRNIFYRLGFNNREIVAICGAHTLVLSTSNIQILFPSVYNLYRLFIALPHNIFLRRAEPSKSGRRYATTHLVSKERLYTPDPTLLQG